MGVFRTLFNGIACRLFAFWNKEGEKLVVATHGIVKKTQQTPQKEIDKAEALRTEWFNKMNKCAMRKVGDMQIYAHEEMLDHVLGEKGTPERDEHDAKIEAFLLGEAIKEVRLSKNITQEELSEKLGVGRAWISRIEKGCNVSLSTLSRVFKALGVGASLNVDGAGTVALA